MKQFQTKSLPAIIVFTILSMMITSILISAQNNGGKKEKRYYIISTASPGGTFYPVGVAIAALVTAKLGESQGISMSAITSAGSGENVQLLKTHEADFAILQGLFGAMAWKGKGKYEGKPEKEMRSVTMLWENVEHFVLFDNFVKTGNIMNLQNAEGERFSIGKRGSGTETSGKVILSALGFNVEKDFKLEHLGYSSSAAALQDRRIVGMNIPAGPPVSAITQAFATIGADKITILQFTDKQLKTVNSKFPVWSRFVIAKDTYPGQKEEIKTIAQPNFLAVRSDIPDKDVYKILETIYNNLDFLHNIHKATYAIKLQRAINGLPVPLHPGAVKFYSDRGIKVPESLILK